MGPACLLLTSSPFKIATTEGPKRQFSRIGLKFGLQFFFFSLFYFFVFAFRSFSGEANKVFYLFFFVFRFSLRFSDSSTRVISTFKFLALSQLEFAFFILWVMVVPRNGVGAVSSVSISLPDVTRLVNCTKGKLKIRLEQESLLDFPTSCTDCKLIFPSIFGKATAQ